MPKRKSVSIEKVYHLFKKHNGLVAEVFKDRTCPLKAQATLYRFIDEHKLKERYDKEFAYLNEISEKKAILNVESMTTLKDGLIIKVMKMIELASVKDVRNIYALKAGWEILRTELNLPTTISQNANLNIEAYANKRTPAEIQKDIDDFLISASDASPKPSIGSES